MSKVYTAQEVADISRLPLSTIHMLMRTKRLPANKIGRQWRITEEAVDNLLKYGTPPKNASPGPLFEKE